MKTLIIVLSVLAATLAVEDASNQNVVVQAPIGRIRGSIMKSRLGKDIYSFRGVRYAKAPVGQLRFHVPVAVQDWHNEFDATEEGPSCPQLRATPGNISEDCLRLNVYTTKLPTSGTKHPETKRPVIVFFHPGGFYVFSGQSFNFGPQYLLDKDVVLVTVNNRMGTLGLLSTGDSVAPGNNAFKDQVVALKWVQRNIAAFGGDPNCVTIAGDSVGGISVMLHMISPMSRGLFHRGIAMSEGIVPAEPYPRDQLNIAKKQADLLGCPSDTTTAAMVECLRTKPVENYTDTMAQFFEFYGDPILVWSAVVEPEVPGVERFLNDQPANLIRKGKINEVPLIASVTRDEFAGVTMFFKKQAEQGNYTLFDQFNADWETIAPISFLYERGTPRSREISRELKQFYLGGKPLSLENIDGLGLLYADSVIISETYRSAKLFAEHMRKPVYLSKFDYQGRYSFSMWNATTPYKIAHHDDLQYVFFMKVQFPFLGPDAPEIPMIEQMTSIWYNFAITGEPIPKNNDRFKDVTWKRLIPREDNYLEMTLTPTMKTGLYTDRMRLWERLFPLPPLSTNDGHHHHHHHH